MKRSTPPLTFDQYKRIYNITNSLAAQFAPPAGQACIFYNLTGAALMQAHYGKKAKLHCGLGAVVLHRADSGEATALSWFEVNESLATASENAFHAWVECEEWVIDFLAPNYREALAMVPAGEKTRPPPIPRKMLMKPRVIVSGELDDLARPGDAVFEGNPALTLTTLERVFSRPAMEDVLHIAKTWHRPFPRRIEPTMTIGASDGEVITLKLIEHSLDGVW